MYMLVIVVVTCTCCCGIQHVTIVARCMLHHVDVACCTCNMQHVYLYMLHVPLYKKMYVHATCATYCSTLYILHVHLILWFFNIMLHTATYCYVYVVACCLLLCICYNICSSMLPPAVACCNTISL